MWWDNDFWRMIISVLLFLHLQNSQNEIQGGVLI